VNQIDGLKEPIRDVGALLTYELNSGGIVKSKG
jgi:hypothetical protein